MTFADPFAWVVVALLVAAIVMLGMLLARLGGRGDGTEQALRAELRAAREDAAREARELRDELARRQHEASEAMGNRFDMLGRAQGERLEGVTKSIEAMNDASERRLDNLRKTVDGQLTQMRDGNEKKLDQMRKTVEEQLQGTLEKRLGESFKLVSERLEAVHRGLGDMQKLAAGVGDLKRVLTNVKTRGSWGEVQLGALLDQVLTPGQFERNVQTKPGSDKRVDFAIRLPGPDDDPDSAVWLPIDSKFPLEDYYRLLDAAESGEADAVQRATSDLTRAVETQAGSIRSKYVAPPHTTDFAILYLATEGLYAEIARRPDVLDRLQRVHRVVPAGPITLAAILNSLQMGFRTLAIERRSSEVWTILSAVKTEFGKFGGVLDKVKTQLDRASKTIDETGRRTRAMERKLRDVEELPGGDGADLLGLAAVDVPDAGPEDGNEDGDGDRDGS